MSLRAALRTGDLSALPSRRQEGWRWTDLRGLIRALPAPAAAANAPAGGGPFGQVDAEEILFVNGFSSQPELLVSGHRTVRLRFLAQAAEATSRAEFGVRVEAGASLTLLESHEAGGGGHIADVTLAIDVQSGGHLQRYVVADDAPDAVAVCTADVTLSPGARFEQTTLTVGARRRRIETRVAHPGGGAELTLDGLYLVGNQRHADLTTVVEHLAPDGVTSQKTKGVAADQGRAVFQGKIVVAHGADRTDARMRHDALLLSDRAEVDAKPELMIYADDVACAHGNTVGALDEAALFYARQRGLSPEAARLLLTEAFLHEIVERIGHEPARAAALAWLEQKLEAFA